MEQRSNNNQDFNFYWMEPDQEAFEDFENLIFNLEYSDDDNDELL